MCSREAIINIGMGCQFLVRGATTISVLVLVACQKGISICGPERRLSSRHAGECRTHSDCAVDLAALNRNVR